VRTTFRHEQDHWSTQGAKIDSEESLAVIRSTIENNGPIIVEWRHYRGSAAPDRLIFDDYDEFLRWLATTGAGDDIWAWDFAVACRDDNSIAHGKAPDESGEVPAGGAY